MNTEKNIYDVIDNVKEKCKDYNDIVVSLTKPYTEKLDKFIDELSIKLFSDVDNNIDMKKHPNFYEVLVLTGNVCLYDIIEEFNNLDLHKEICKLIYDNKYNDAYIEYADDKSLKRTINELTSLSEMDCEMEKTVLHIYETSINIIKQKIASAKQLIDYLEKISLVNVTDEKKIILNE